MTRTTLIFLIAASLASATLGFLVWNFPFGRVFLGDGGAYFLGFMLAELAVTDSAAFASLVETAKKALPADVNAPKSAA